MLKQCVGASMLALMVVACGQSPPTGIPAPITYQGRTLPTPAPVFLPPDPAGEPTAGQRRSLTGPPPAWLLVGDEAVPASYGSFCYSSRPNAMHTCADYVPPAMRDDLVIVSLPPTAPARIIVGDATASLQELHLHKWAPASEASSSLPPPNAIRTVQAEGRREGDLMVFRLEPFDDVDDQVLVAMFSFPHHGDASYVWRLNPAH